MGPGRMRVGLVLPIEQPDAHTAPMSYAGIREVALAAEASGLDSLWVFDHLLFRFDGETTGIHECWTVLSAIAEATSRVQLGTIVMCTSFRNPALLAKMAATLDHISDGRLVLGIGCGWHDPEYEAFGYPTDHKVGRFEEALTVIRSLIREGRADLDGRWVTVRDAVLLPPARPDLPILIAAKRPRMLDLTARHADAWNLAWFGAPDERLGTARADLGAALARADRDPATLDITVGVTVRYLDLLPDDAPQDGPAMSGSEAVRSGLAAHAAAGADHLIVALEPATVEAVERLARDVDAWRAVDAAAGSSVDAA
jgi:alkanesulfonate monooxygenase SsuD/methylene tetrahydromethanopterin reductase-like flavin-dependent oxidoreductase (luciferase family)